MSVAAGRRLENPSAAYDAVATDDHRFRVLICELAGAVRVAASECAW
jgi:hypothetical protein